MGATSLSRRILSLALGAICWTCASPAAKPSHTVHGCSPLVTGQCVTPFPNAWFEQPKSPTATGYQVVFPKGDLPAESNGTPLNPSLIGFVDGFSPATQIVAWFPQGVNANQLSPSSTTPIDARIPMSLDPNNPIVLIDVTTRERVPFFAELDANADPAAGDRQALLIHPMVRLQNATRYAVAIRTSLQDGSGKPLAPEGEFADWVHGKLSQSEDLSEISDRLDEDATAFAALGISKSDLALAWDFDTASVESTTGQLTQMSSQALQASQALGFTVTSTTTTASDPNTYQVIQGTFEGPSFETGPDPSVLALNGKGQAIMGKPASWTFTALIPQCALTATAPLPVLVIGHGIFSSAAAQVPGSAQLLQSLCMVGIGTDWLGLSQSDLPILGDVLSDVNQFPLVTGRLEQAHVNFQVLAQLSLNGLAKSAAFTLDGKPVIDTAHLYYWGLSNGAIQGGTFMALSPVATHGALSLPGAIWTLLMWRSNDFAAMLIALQTLYPDKLDLQFVLALTQSLWDKTDPIEFAPLLVSGGKQVLYQESVDDPVVTNVATRALMRTLDATALGPLVEPVYGLNEGDGPLTGLVYTQWSIDPSPVPPLTDVPPIDNGAHYYIPGLPGATTQIKDWLQPDGQGVNPCGGTCVFPQ